MRSMSYSELLVMDLQSITQKQRELETAQEDLIQRWRQRQIADIERLLSQLTEEQRAIIEMLMIEKKSETKTANELRLTVREVREIKNHAIHLLCVLRHGAAYQI